MNIPKLNVTVVKAATNGQVVDVVEYEEFVKNKSLYQDRNDVAIPVEDGKGKEILLPIKGKYPTNGSTPISPGVYTAGAVDFFIKPDEMFVDRYISKNKVVMNNNDSIRDLIIAEEQSKKLDEPFITSPDNITNIPIKESDQPEMILLKTAINCKRTDIDSYQGRFGSNYPNDKRQLKSDSATLNIIKRYCKNMDMECTMTLRDASDDVPNPIGKEITISLTNPESINKFFNEMVFNYYTSNESDDDSEEYDN